MWPVQVVHVPRVYEHVLTARLGPTAQKNGERQGLTFPSKREMDSPSRMNDGFVGF